MDPLLCLLSKRKRDSLFCLFSSASPIPCSVLAAHLHASSTSTTDFLRCRDQDCTQCSHVDASVGKKWHPLSYSHWPSWLWTVFLIMGNILLALLLATAHRAGDFRDLSMTTPELQPLLLSLPQRHYLGYLPYGHHRTLNLVCHLFTHSILWATFRDVCHWHSIWLSKRASYHPKPWKSTAHSLLPVHWWRHWFSQELTQKHLGPHAPWILLYWTFFPLMYLTIFQNHANSQQPGETMAMTSRVALCHIQESTYIPLLALSLHLIISLS